MYSLRSLGDRLGISTQDSLLLLLRHPSALPRLSYTLRTSPASFLQRSKLIMTCSSPSLVASPTTLSIAWKQHGPRTLTQRSVVDWYQECSSACALCLFGFHYCLFHPGSPDYPHTLEIVICCHSAAGHKDTTTPLHPTQCPTVRENGTLQGLRLQLKLYWRMLQMQGPVPAS